MNITQDGSIQQQAPQQNTSSGQQDIANDQLRRLGEKVEKADLPPELRQTLTERVQRLALIRASAGFLSPNYVVEYENANAYIKWATGLPWTAVSQDKLDLNAAKEML